MFATLIKEMSKKCFIWTLFPFKHYLCSLKAKGLKGWLWIDLTVKEIVLNRFFKGIVFYYKMIVSSHLFIWVLFCYTRSLSITFKKLKLLQYLTFRVMLNNKFIQKLFLQIVLWINTPQYLSIIKALNLNLFLNYSNFLLII